MLTAVERERQDRREGSRYKKPNSHNSYLPFVLLGRRKVVSNPSRDSRHFLRV
jgi:hypothetical protein